MGAPKNRTDGVPLVAISAREGSEVIYATHNFCDRTTWYSQSVRVTSEALVDSGDGLTWTSAHTNWIDLVSGKVMDDDGIRTEADHGWLVAVTVDGAEKTPREALEDSGGDYTINFAAGTITFAQSQAGKDVRASYSYENGSAFILRPMEGCTLDIESAEAQLSDDLVLNDTLRFSIHGFAAVFAPDLVAQSILAPTDLVELGADRYKRVHQIIDNALGAFPAVPAIGGSARGFTRPVHGFPFRYGTLRRLFASYGMELRVSLEHDRPCGGEYATATFYAVSTAETDILPPTE